MEKYRVVPITKNIVKSLQIELNKQDVEGYDCIKINSIADIKGNIIQYVVFKKKEEIVMSDIEKQDNWFKRIFK